MAIKPVKKITDKQIENALKRSMGIIANAINYIRSTYNIEISRQAIYSRINKSAKLKRTLEEARENVIDLCESVVMKAIAKGDSQLAFKVLCKLGKNRGYNDMPPQFENEDKTEKKIIFDVPDVYVESKAGEVDER